jgi:hypothetical protein
MARIDGVGRVVRGVEGEGFNAEFAGSGEDAECYFASGKTIRIFSLAGRD